MTALPPLLISPPADDPLLTKKDLADRWQCSVSFIEKRQSAELPPRCGVIPGQARYRLSDILRFEASRVDATYTLEAGANPKASPLSHPIPGFPIRLPVTGKADRPRPGRRPVPAIQDSKPG